jgi:hypothetical protein
VKTLPDILRDAMILLADDDRENVVIARGHTLDLLDVRSQAFQLRLQRDDHGYVGETRCWLGAQWSNWHVRQGWLGGAGFDIRDVLATDWRISS